MVCGDDRDKCTIENAKAVALRLRMAEADAVATSGASGEKTVIFQGASMSDDRLKTVEMDMQSQRIRLEW